MLTTVVGHYPKIGGRSRAPNLRTAIANYDAGKISLEELHRVEDEVTKEVLAEQAQAGIDLLTDGQIRWEDGQTYFARRIGGFSINGLVRYFDTNTYYRQPVAEKRLSWQGPISVRDYQFARQHSPKPVKPVVTGPYTLARLSLYPAYPDLETFVLHLADILNQELLTLQAENPPLIQVDEPAILKWKDDFPLFQKAMQRLTRGVTVPLALQTWFRDLNGLYPDFFRLPFQVFGLDFVLGKANYTIIRSFPSDKILGLGCVDARNTKLETVDDVVDCVRRVKPLVGLDRLYLSPSCGLEYLPRDRAYEKLVRLVDGARKAQEVLA
ncbi:MAG: methylcobamide--CoM methyltransferase [Dehalococcoidia bacterium]|nr:methylcobamide--CoM methyltransferase [Dehalococcoidia bacterium]MDW8119444.1 methylcobamide--CoM methyltransferase [Chloroflexota bacterium]